MPSSPISPLESELQRLRRCLLWLENRVQQATQSGEPAAPVLDSAELAQCMAALQSLESRGRHNSRMQLLSMAVEQSPLGIVVMDIAGRVEYCNRGLTR